MDEDIPVFCRILSLQRRITETTWQGQESNNINLGMKNRLRTASVEVWTKPSWRTKKELRRAEEEEKSKDWDILTCSRIEDDDGGDDDEKKLKFFEARIWKFVKEFFSFRLWISEDEKRSRVFVKKCFDFQQVYLKFEYVFRLLGDEKNGIYSLKSSRDKRFSSWELKVVIKLFIAPDGLGSAQNARWCEWTMIKWMKHLIGLMECRPSHQQRWCWWDRSERLSVRTAH